MATMGYAKMLSFALEMTAGSHKINSMVQKFSGSHIERKFYVINTIYMTAIIQYGRYWLYWNTRYPLKMAPDSPRHYMMCMSAFTIEIW